MFILSDRVKETSSTVGSGSVALNGAYGAFQSFNQGIGNGNETYYAIENNSRWEVGKGVYTSSSNSLSRDVVLNSSASGAKINLEGISVVFCTLPASKATAKDLQGQVSLSGIIFSDSTVQTTAAVSPDLSSYLTSGVAASTYVSLSGSYTNPSWIVSIPSTKVTGLGTLATQSGTFSGTSSGTNTGDQTSIVGISGTKAQFDTSCSDGNFLYVGDAVGVTDGDKGDITVSVSGATWIIDSGVVSLAKLSDMATASVFYRKTAGSGTPEIQTLSTLKTDLGLTGTNSGDQTTIVGISGTKVQFDTSVTDGNFLYVGDAPTSHAHGNITNAGAIGSTTDLPIVTTTSGVLIAGSFGTTAGTFAAGDDSRITGALSTSTAAVTYQPLDADLTSLAAASGSGIYERSGGNWTPVTIGTGLYLGSGTLSNTLDLSSYLTSSVASGTYLPLAGGTLTGDLKFTDATYDIGKSGATRPRDGFFSRNVTVGGNATVDKISVGGASIVGYINLPNYQWINWGGSNLMAGSSSLGIGLNGVPLYGVSNLSARDISAVNGTTATELAVHETYTSSTSYGKFRVKANAAAAYQIGSAKGSAGGSNQAVQIGHWDAAGTFTAGLTVETNGDLVTSKIYLDSAKYSNITATSDGYVVSIANRYGASFQFRNAFTAPYFSLGSSEVYTPKIRVSTIGSALDSNQLNGNASTTPMCLVGLYGGSYTDNSRHAIDIAAVLGQGGVPPSGTTTGGNAGKFIIALKSGGAGSGGAAKGSDGSFDVQNSDDLVGFRVMPQVATTGSPTLLTLTGAAHTTLTLSTEATDVNFNLARTVQFATGALTTQRAMRIQAPTYGFVGASTITTASTLSISGAPVAGTNATITNAYALNVESGNVKVPKLAIGSGQPELSLIHLHVIDSDSGSVGFYVQNTNATVSVGSQPRVAIGQGGTTAFSIAAWQNRSYIEGQGSTGMVVGVENAPLYLYSSRTNYLTGITLNSSNRVLIGTSVDDSTAKMHVAGGLNLRDATNAQTLRVYNTYTSATSYERVNVRGKASANFEIGPENGSAGGTLRGLTIGCYPAGTATIVGWAQFRPNASTGALEAFYLGPIADGTAVGGNARGTNSVDLQTLRNAASQSAVASNSFVAGSYCTATSTATNGVAIGSSAYVSEFGAVAIGNSVSATQPMSLAMGSDTIAGASVSIALGRSSRTNKPGQLCLANGKFSTQGDAQWAIHVVRNTTTNNTPTLLLMGYEWGFTPTDRIYLPSGKLLFANILISGIKSDGSASACYKRKVAIKNVGGTTALVGTVEAIGTDIEDNVLTDVAITADNTNDALQINVTGISGETWRWVAVIEGLEIAYGV